MNRVTREELASVMSGAGVDLENRLRAILARHAKAARPCRACGEPLWFVSVPAGGVVPYQADGRNHFETCPHREEFRRREPPTKPGQAALFDGTVYPD